MIVVKMIDDNMAFHEIIICLNHYARLIEPVDMLFLIYVKKSMFVYDTPTNMCIRNHD